MKKLLILAISLGVAPLLQAAAPHIILDDDSHQISYNAIGTLVRQEPLTYTLLTEPGMAEGPDVTPFYQAWFRNVLERIQTEEQRRQLAPVLPILEYGALATSYQRVKGGGILTVFFTGQVERHCGRYTAGCYMQNTIYVPPTVSKTTFIHEIGHSLRQGDLYNGQVPAAQGEFGTGVRDSVMNHSKTLTCDDADGLINAIYRALVRQNPQQPDVVFTSLCDGETKFANAYELNRALYIIEGNELQDRGSWYIYTYCKDGGIKTMAQFRPDDVKNLIKVLGPERECKASDSVVERHVAEPGETQLPIAHSGGAVISLLQDKETGVPVVRVLGHKRQLLYLLAKLPEGYNLVYRVFDTEASNSLLFVYKRGEPSQNYAYTGKETFLDVPDYTFHCGAEEAACQEMQTVFEKYQPLFAKQYGTVYTRWASKVYDSFTEKAQAWDTFLEEHLPL